MNFSDAETHCQNNGGQLMSISDATESAAIQAAVASFNVQHWIGLQQVDGGVLPDNVFEWTDGSSMGFESWAANQPDSVVSECGSLGAGGVWWYDRFCTDTLPALCTLCGNAMSSQVCFCRVPLIGGACLRPQVLCQHRRKTVARTRALTVPTARMC